MPLPSKPETECILLFCFHDNQPVMLKSPIAVARDGKKLGFKIKHPISGKEVSLKFFKIRPDFKRKKIIYEFIEDIT